MDLLTRLESANLTVRAVSGWETRTVPRGAVDRTQTVGVCNHWDAISSTPIDSYYTTTNRFGGPIYNIVVNRDGLVRLFGQRLTWHAGSGDPDVLAALRAGILPPQPADRWQDGKPVTTVTSGNPWLFGVSLNYHPDDGPVPAAQYDALVTVNRVLIDHYELSATQVIDHRNWTTRKRDIDTLSMHTLRHDIHTRPTTLEEDDQMLKETLIDLAFAAGWAEPDTQAARDYWYAVDPGTPEWSDMRSAIIRGATKLRHGTTDGTAALQTLAKIRSVI